MAYFRPDDRVGGYPMAPDLGAGLSDIGAIDRGLRPVGDYGYGVPSYGGPLDGEYAPEYYGAERPGRYAREAYAPSVYDEGYAPRQPPFMPEPSDLGLGLRDAGKVPEFGAGYGRPEFAGAPGFGGARGFGGDPGFGGTPGFGGAPGYGRAPGYGGAMSADDEVRQLRKELAHERREKHELELATGAALGYGLHERHEKKEEEDDDDDDDDEGYDRKKEKKRHRFFHRGG